MKKLTRAALLLGAGALCALAAACGGGDAEVTTDSDAKSLSYWVALPTQISAHYTSMAEMTVYQELEKKTGMHIDFVHVPPAQEQEKFTLMIASGNMPDLIETNWKRYYQGGPTKALQDGMIVEADEYLEKCAPNFKQLMDENDESRRSVVTSDGHYCVFPRVRRSDDESKAAIKSNFGGMMIRKDWLDKLGMELPETIEEWDTVLHAFQSELGIANPLMLDAGWFKVEGNGNDFNNAYGVDKGWYVKDGKVKFGPAEPGYKEYVELMKKWYTDGILDPEFDTTGGSTLMSKIIDGATGATYAFLGTMGSILSSKELPEGFDLQGTQFPVMNKGDEPYFMNKATLVSYPQIAVSKNCKNPELAFSWIDNLYSEEGAILNYYGVEGLTYTKADEENKVTYTDEIVNNPEGLTVNEALAKHVRAFTNIAGLTPKTKTTNSKYTIPAQQESYERYNEYFGNVFEVQIPEIEYPAETAEEVSSIEFDINNFVWETVIRFIKGTEPMENYDKFLEQLKTLKLDRLTEIKQDAYENYMKN